MMKNTILYTTRIAALAAVLLAGCSKSEPQTTPETPAATGDEIRAVASVLSVDTDARTGTKAVVTEVKDLKVLVLTSTDEEDFTTPYAKGTMTFNGTAEAGYDADGFTGTKILPTDKSSLYMAAVHPHTGWTDGADANTLQFTFTGKEDVLLSETQSVVAKGATEVAAFTFKHLLTKIDISVKAEDANSIAAWGAIQKIEITNFRGKFFSDIVTVTLDKTNWGFNKSLSSPAPTVWPTYLATDGNTAFTGQSLALTTTAAPAATTIMNIFEAKNDEADLEISVTTKTDSGSAVVTPIKIALPAGITLGKQYTVNLNFKTKQIKGTATVTPWDAATPIDKDVD